MIGAGLVAATWRQLMPRPTLVTAAWAVTVAVTAAATITARDPLLALLGDTTRHMGLAATVVIGAAFVLGTASGRDGWRGLRTAVVAGGAVAIGGGLLQLTGVVRHSGRLTSTMGNAAFLGALLCVVLPVVVAAALSEPAHRRWAIPLALAGGAVLLGTGTRGAWLGVVVGLGLVAAAQWRVPRLGVIVGVVALGVVAVVAPVGGRGEPGSPGTARGRLDMWQVGARVVADRPVLGWGPEGTRIGFARAMDASFTRAYGLRQLPDRAHNRFLDVAAATGAVGLLADVALLAAAALALRRAAADAADAADPARRAFVVGVGGAVVAWLVQGQFLFDVFDVSVLLWLLVGAALATEAAAVGNQRIGGPVLSAALAGVVALAAVGVVADRAVQAASGTAPVQAYRRLDDAIALRPRALDAYLLLGTVARATGDPSTLRAAHRRLAVWDDDEVRLADARVLAALGDASNDPRRFRQAATELVRLTRLRPADGRVWAALALVRASLGDDAAAQRAAAMARSLLPPPRRA